jgi:tetratricopeptide (TPR) repeat protein
MELDRYEPARTLLEAGLQIARACDGRGEIAFCLNVAGGLAEKQGHYAEARSLCQQSLAISSELNHQEAMALATNHLGFLTAFQGEFAEAKRLGERGLAISRALGRPDLIAGALDELVVVTWFTGEYAEMEEYNLEYWRIAQESGDQFLIADALCNLGMLAWLKEGVQGGEVCPSGTEAIAYLEEGVAMFQALGARSKVATHLGNLGQVANSVGQYEQAQRYCREALALASALGDLFFVNYALTSLGYATCRLGDYQTSRHYLLEALRVGHALQVAQTPQALVYYGVLLLSDPALMPAAQPFAKQAQALTLFVVAQSSPQTWHFIKELAARFQAQLEAELPAEIVTVARARGQQLTLAETVTEILQAAGE